MMHLLAYDSPEYEVLRALDSHGTARLLDLRRISPSHTFMKRGDNGFCESLLYYAVDYRWYEGIALFMWYGGQPSAHEPCQTRTPLAYAQANADDVDGRYVLALFGRWAVDAPIDDDTGATALMHAAEHGHAYAVRLLWQRHGANLHARNARNANALYYAMQRVDRQLRRRQRQWDYDGADEAKELDPVLALLIGPLDPVEYASTFRFAMNAIRQYALRTVAAQTRLRP